MKRFDRDILGHENVPRTTYRVGGVILTKEKIFISHENRILIRYTLVDAHSETTLRFRPVLAFREANALCIANDAIRTDCPEVPNGISCNLYPGLWAPHWSPISRESH